MAGYYRSSGTGARQRYNPAIVTGKGVAMNVRLACAAASIVFVLAGGGEAQQTVPFRNNIPVAPQGIAAIPPLPDKPVVYHTAEGQDIRVVVVAKGLSHPWSLAFLPDGS